MYFFLASSSASTRGQLSVRAKHLDHMRFIRTATSRIPKQPLPTPSKILLLGKSVALPRPCHEGIHTIVIKRVVFMS